MVSVRNKTAAYLAIVGGILILVGGGTGMVGLLTQSGEIVENMMGDSNETIELIFKILIFIAALGGLAVIIGGLLFYKDHVISGRIIIALGAGIGIIGLIIGLLIALFQGEGEEFFSWLTTSFVGVGIVLSLTARFVAKSF
jgi:hypothetical protein